MTSFQPQTPEQLKKELDAFDFSDDEQTPEIQKIEPTKAPVVQAKPIAIVDNQVTAKDNSELWRLAVTLMKGEGVPRHLNTPEKVVAAWNLAASLGVSPQPALRNIAFINGSPSLWGDLPKALAQKTGELQFYDEYIIDKDYKRISFENKNLDAEIFAGVAVIQRKGKEKKEFTFTKKQAELAGIWGKNVWKTYPEVMIKARARSMALKSEFADALLGVSIGEYDHDTQLGFRDVGVGTSDNGLASKLNGITEQ